jgi:hypothetical protein
VNVDSKANERVSCPFCGAGVGQVCRNGFGILLDRHHDVRGGEIDTTGLAAR